MKKAHKCKKKYRRAHLYNFTSRLYKFLATQSECIVLKKMRGVYGTYDGEEIDLDYRRDIVSTLIHEVLHCFNPDWSETRVGLAERQIINALSVQQIKNILRRFANVL